MSSGNWFNFKTQEFKYRRTPEDFADYIPQSPTAQSLYGLLTDVLGQTPAEAAREVLLAYCGKLKETNEPT